MGDVKKKEKNIEKSFVGEKFIFLIRRSCLKDRKIKKIKHNSV